MRRTRRARAALVVVALVIVAGVGGGIVAITSGPHLTPEQIEAARLHREFVAEQHAASTAERLVAAHLPTKTAAPAPLASEPIFTAPLPAHHVVGYVPYWELASVQPADVTDASELVYSSVCPAANGSIDPGQPGSDCAHGLADLSSAALASLVTAAHAAGDRVLLSVETTNDARIETIDAHAGSVAPVLAANLAALERTYGFDGTNIDFEGTNPADREPYVRFARLLTTALRADVPGGEILIDTYAAAAAGSRSFFDPKRLAPLADALFVMNYSLQSNDHGSAGSPLATNDLGYSAVQTLIEYTKLVPPAKLILGVPFYGFDFETVSGRPGALATAAAPSSQPYRAIVHAAFPPLWDPTTETPFSRFVRDGQWHQLWFDDPVSIALKVALAADFHTAGVGAWAYGMEDGNALMLSALTGDRAPLRTPLARRGS
jgi:hypothetical protein